MFITLKPRSQWKKARTQAEFTELLDKALRDLPGQRLAYSQPIEMRINEMVSGVRADLGVKLFGDDFDVLVEEGGRDRGRAAVDPGSRRREHRADHRPADAADQGQPGRRSPATASRPRRCSTSWSRSAASRWAKWSRGSSAFRWSCGCRRVSRTAPRRSASMLVADRRPASGFRSRGWRRSQSSKARRRSRANGASGGSR